MTERTNRRDNIIKAAACLFIEQGYAATSVREIAEAVGVTEAALYYHFKDGKRELLQAVLGAKTSEMVTVLDELEGATSLDDLMARFGQAMLRLSRLHGRTDMLRWLIAEYDRFTQAERDAIHEKQELLHRHLVGYFVRFAPTRLDAERLAWFLLCAVIGYEQFFMGMGYLERADFPPEAMLAMLRSLVPGKLWFSGAETTEGPS
ncbi:MAG: TetR/AcrR family transcriptional regulator [Anaerolineae bacterium]|nr:TetR/AcrR family transcriptional regulator [Anaerolineae bacterium]